MATDQVTTPTIPDYHNDAEVYQNLSGAAAATNPYLPFLQPKVITKPDGSRVLRIPKNQQLQDLASFFDTSNQKQFNTANDFAKSYLEFLKSGTGGREDKRLAYDLNKPYFKPVGITTKKVASVKKLTNSVGGFTFTQKQSDGTSKPITAAEYASVTGENVIDVLSKSKDPGDQKVIADTNALQAKVDSGEITLDDALQALRTDYPHVYGSSS